MTSKQIAEEDVEYEDDVEHEDDEEDENEEEDEDYEDRLREQERQREKRINFPSHSATYFNNMVFERVFPRLGKRPSKSETEAHYRSPFSNVAGRSNKPHLQIVYTALYSACFHEKEKRVSLSVMDIARRTGIDWRTVKSDLFYLEQMQLIEVLSEG